MNLKNRKQRRRERRHPNRSMERILEAQGLVKKMQFGPSAVSDEPTKAHVKALLLEWLWPRMLVAEITKQVTEKLAKEIANDPFYWQQLLVRRLNRWEARKSAQRSVQGGNAGS